MNTQILTRKEINQKLDRIAYQIVEDNFEEKALVLIGIKGNGKKIADDLAIRLNKIGQQTITVGEITIHKKNPFEEPITLDLTEEEIENQTLILIDDVVNSGRTMQYSLLKLLETPTKRIKTVALIDRKHRDFPIRCDYVGLTLSTTMQDHIEVKIGDEVKAYLR